MANGPVWWLSTSYYVYSLLLLNQVINFIFIKNSGRCFYGHKWLSFVYFRIVIYFYFFVFNQCSSIFSCLCITLFDKVSFDAAGFLSIDWGGQTNYSAENNIQWVTDVNYIDVGETAYTGDATQQAYDSSVHSLWFFPNPLKKSCYQLPVIPNVPYLLRLWFAIRNYTGFQNSSTFTFSLY